MKKILNVRNGVLSGALIATILITGLAGCEKRENFTNDNQGSIVIGDVIPEEQINELEDKQYFAGDISVIQVYNPIEEKDNYYFVVYSQGSFKPMSKADYLLAFEGTCLEDKINSGEVKTDGTFYEYKSITDDSATFTAAYYSAISGNTAGTYTLKTLSINDIRYFAKSLNLQGNTNEYDESYECYVSGEFYSDCKIIETPYTYLYNCSSSERVSESELLRQLEELNNNLERN